MSTFQTKVDFFCSSSILLDTDMYKSLLQFSNKSAISYIWKTANCLHFCIYLCLLSYSEDRHLPQVQDMTQEMGGGLF